MNSDIIVTIVNNCNQLKASGGGDCSSKMVRILYEIYSNNQREMKKTNVRDSLSIKEVFYCCSVECSIQKNLQQKSS